MIRRPPRSTRFPSTTLFRSLRLPELLLLGSRRELDEFPSLVLVRGGRVYVEGLVANRAVARLPIGGRTLRDSHLILLDLRPVGGARGRGDGGPAALADGMLPEEGAIRRFLGLARHALGSHPVFHHGAVGTETRDGLGLAHQYPGGILRVENLTAVRPDELAAVAHAAFVSATLEDEAEVGARVCLCLQGHLLQLIPGLWWAGEAALLQKVLAVVEQPGIREPRNPIGLALVDYGLHGPGQEVGAQLLGEDRKSVV